MLVWRVRRVACVACGADKNQAKIDASVLRGSGSHFNTKGSVVVAASAIRALQSRQSAVSRAGQGREWSRERARERQKSVRHRASGAKTPSVTFRSGAYIVNARHDAQAYQDAAGADAGLSAATRAVVGADQRRRLARAVDRGCTGACRVLIRAIRSVPALPC